MTGPGRKQPTSACRRIKIPERLCSPVWDKPQICMDLYRIRSKFNMIFIPSTLISDLPGEVEIQHDPFKNSRRISVSILLSWSEYFVEVLHNQVFWSGSKPERF